MKIAFGILGVLLILAIVYYFLPQGIKTTFRGIFGGSNTTQTVKATPTAAPSFSPLPTAVAQASLSPSPTAGLIRAVTPSPRASASASLRAATVSGTAKLPSTGVQNQPIEVTLIQILASALLILVGYRLSKHI